MKEWRFANGVEVQEAEYNRNLHCFQVHHCVHQDCAYMGAIYPASAEDMQKYIDRLDSGEDPVTAGWSNGKGQRCRQGGWLTEAELLQELSAARQRALEFLNLRCAHTT